MLTDWTPLRCHFLANIVAPLMKPPDMVFIVSDKGTRSVGLMSVYAGGCSLRSSFLSL